MAGYAGRRHQWLSLLLTGVACAAPDPPTTPPAAAPSAELLQYLDEFTDASGEFIDPVDIATNGNDSEDTANAQPAEAEVDLQPRDAQR